MTALVIERDSRPFNTLEQRNDERMSVISIPLTCQERSSIPDDGVGVESKCVHGLSIVSTKDVKAPLSKVIRA